MWKQGAQRSHASSSLQTRPSRARLSVQGKVATVTVPARTTMGIKASNPAKLAAAEQQVLDALRNAKGRGASGLSSEQVEQLEACVEVLEADGGVVGPTASPALLDGKWKLLYTTRPGTSSPVQRSFTGVESFQVFQEVQLGNLEEGARVTNVVDGGSYGVLRVEACASTESRPIPGFTPRSEPGIALFGTSDVRPPTKPNIRIDFQFDRAYFKIAFLPFEVPYPVPFRLLGDESKGWLDVTYLSRDGMFRLSRGNKGTLFVLVREVTPKEQLLAAIRAKDGPKINELVEVLSQQNPTPKPARSPLVTGKWRLLWSVQAANAAPLQKFSAGQVDSFQIVDAETGYLENLVLFTPWLRLAATAECSATSDTRTSVFINQGGVNLGPLRIPLPLGQANADNPGYVDWLYLDPNFRITRGSKGSVFIHEREV